ncbi:hypothetical protein [Calothrix sp. CCY 0018]|uniref:hypothetical protein n=1 Tax=Calothrix sp. CCY 0018 TaxID=3103864 RepID=UPI0039C62391
MNKLVAALSILAISLPLPAVASNINDDMDFFATNSNLIIALDNKTNTACSFNTKTGSVVKMSGVKFTNTRMVGASYWWGTLSGNLNHFLNPKTLKINKIKGKWSDNNAMLIKRHHHENHGDYTAYLGSTCVKKGGLAQIAKVWQ